VFALLIDSGFRFGVQLHQGHAERIQRERERREGERGHGKAGRPYSVKQQDEPQAQGPLLAAEYYAKAYTRNTGGTHKRLSVHFPARRQSRNPVQQYQARHLPAMRSRNHNPCSLSSKGIFTSDSPLIALLAF